MSVHGTRQSIELANMVGTESCERSTAESPLLVASSTEDDQDDLAAVSGDRIGSRSGHKFIWALTFSAGISGLLFGYE